MERNPKFIKNKDKFFGIGDGVKNAPKSQVS
jgi:hypothetical protein